MNKSQVFALLLLRLTRYFKQTDTETDRQTHLLWSISHGSELGSLQCHPIALQRRRVLRPERSLPHRPPTIIIIIIIVYKFAVFSMGCQFLFLPVTASLNVWGLLQVGGGRLGGVHDRLHIYPLCGIFYFPWHRHQIERTNGFYCLIRKTERFTISNVESQVFTPRIILAQPGRWTRAAGVQSVRPTTGLTAPL